MAKFFINDNHIQWDTSILESTVNVKTDTTYTSTFIFPSNAARFNIINKDSTNLVYYDFSENKMYINNDPVLTAQDCNIHTNNSVIDKINDLNIQGQVKVEFSGNKLILTKMF